jgi:hypothetical protein
MKCIFNNYTGNAMLNNALMTIEALAELNGVSEITPELLILQYDNIGLQELNNRLKSYTMLFTKNGPLKNDRENGQKIYKVLFEHIVNNFENTGKFICEITGLNFSKTFDELFKEALEKVGLSNSDINKKDTTINRTWFPLIGGLGSDAQALPQAKFAIRIHPICIPIMQFLPISSVLYRGRILLIDSSNFEFSREFIAQNVKDVRNRIQLTSSKDSIENIKDYSRGHYILKAIQILEEKEFEDEYSDLNLWSFSNSGTGASCDIERIPNDLIKKLLKIKQNPETNNELKSILISKGLSYTFIEALENNTEWNGLYPAVFGSGNKKVEYDGVSVEFLEEFFKQIGSVGKIGYAKYLAYLIGKFKSDSFGKYLNKRDAYRDKNYHSDLFTVLVKAACNGEWDLDHHINILDDKDELPTKNYFYHIVKLTHFYYYKKKSEFQLPAITNKSNKIKHVSEWLIALIQQDINSKKIIKHLTNAQTNSTVGYSSLFFRASQDIELDIESILYSMYDKGFKRSLFGINALLRIFFSQPKQRLHAIKSLAFPIDWELEKREIYWINQIREFADDYKNYYFAKYKNTNTGAKPLTKFLNLVNHIPINYSKFLTWFYEAVENTNAYLVENKKSTLKSKWSNALLYEPIEGEYAIGFAIFAIKFSLLKQYQTEYNSILND